MANDEPIQFTPRQRDIFQRVSKTIRATPSAFTKTGRRLDDEVAPEIEKYERCGAVSRVTYRLVSDPPNFDAMRPDLADQAARRVLLLAWVLSDPADLATTPSITALQAWEWGTHSLEGLDKAFDEEGGVDDESVWELNRLYARIHQLDPQLELWTSLCERALERIEEMKQPTVPVAPPKQKTKRRGRPTLTPTEARSRNQLLNKYRARKGLSQKEFCDAQGISTTELKKLLAWATNRKERAGNKIVSRAK